MSNGMTCAVCKEPSVVTVPIGEATIALCATCGPGVSAAIHNKLSLINRVTLTAAEATERMVTSIATYSIDVLLNELIACTVHWHVGPLEADRARVATALIERMAAIGIARKVHRDGCAIWPHYRLCACPWEIAS